MKLEPRQYTRRVSSYARRHWGPEEEEHYWKRNSGTAIVGLVATVLVVAAGFYFWPDFQRYMKIRRM